MLTYPLTLSKLPRASGFTLIEILVVVGIVAIVLSVAVLSLSSVDDDRQIRREALRFMSLVDVAQDEAMMQGREIGLELMNGSYRFIEYDPIGNNWYEIPGDDHLGLRRLPEEIELHLYIEDQQVLLDTDPAEIDANDDTSSFGSIERYAPHVLIFSSGDRTPFELHFVRSQDEQSVVLQSDLLGTLEILPDED